MDHSTKCANALVPQEVRFLLGGINFSADDCTTPRMHEKKSREVIEREFYQNSLCAEQMQMVYNRKKKASVTYSKQITHTYS